MKQSAVCAPILYALPDWFGIEAATQRYIDEINNLPVFLAEDGDAVLGFLAIRQHNPFSAEIYVMGVLPEMHHQGIGRALVQKAESYLSGLGIEYLQVKTLSSRHPDEGYALTRAFYQSMGFRPLEEFDEIWGAENPCLLQVKKIA